MIGQTIGLAQTTLFAPPPEPAPQTSTQEVAPTSPATSASDSLSSGTASGGGIAGSGTSAKDTAALAAGSDGGRTDLDAASTGAIPRSLSGPPPAFVVSELEATLNEQALRINAEDVREATLKRQVVNSISRVVDDLAQSGDLQIAAKAEPKAAETKDATNGFAQAGRLSEPYQSGALDLKT